jgi:hypothetical protein
MKTIEVMGHVDEQHRLSGSVPPDIEPGPVRVQLMIESPADESELAGPTWEQAIAADWSEDWLDPREDIYTLQDGKPVKQSGPGDEAR